MKFKVGDKVKIKNNLKGIDAFNGGYIDELDKYVGNIVTIAMMINENSVRFREIPYTWDTRALELANITTINDLQFADVVTLRNGERYVVADDYLYGEDDDYYIDSRYIEDYYNNDLTYNEDDGDYDDEGYDIVKVERNGSIIYEREETKVKEMTVAEISEALGYEVKIVKEK